MKKNKGFTLVELIVVLACFVMVTGFFWTMLNSSSEDSYTLNDKVAVQSSVTSLMNIIQQDVQEAKIFTKDSDEKIIVYINSETSDGAEYYLKDVAYIFQKGTRCVFRKTIDAEGKGKTSNTYSDIVEFSMTPVKNSGKYGVEVNIIGGKVNWEYGEHDKSKYELNATYYTRNTQ